MEGLEIQVSMDLVIGAGVSGISYANFTGNDYLIVEKEDEPGGYCRTVRRNGYVWDYSGHFFHFRHPEIEGLVRRGLPPSAVVEAERHTQVYYGGRYVDFPFQKNIHQLDKEEFIDCLYDLFSSAGGGGAGTFKEMVYSSFGKSIAEKFLVPYNEKLYACDLDSLDKDAMGRFFPKACREDIVLNFRSRDDTSYNSTFTYPRGGAAEYVRALLRGVDGGKVCLGEELLGIDMEAKVATTDRRRIRYDRLISTEPLPALLRHCRLDHDPHAFSCNKVLVFNLGFDSKGDDRRNSWVYVPGREYSFYRLGYYDNILGTDRMSLYVELGFPEGEPLRKEGLYLNRVMDDLRKIGVVTTQRLVDYEAVLMNPAYVHVSRESREAVARYKEVLAAKDIYSIGRYGSWTYCSIEDNILEARETARRLSRRVPD